MLVLDKKSKDCVWLMQCDWKVCKLQLYRLPISTNHGIDWFSLCRILPFCPLTYTRNKYAKSSSIRDAWKSDGVFFLFSFNLNILKANAPICRVLYSEIVWKKSVQKIKNYIQISLENHLSNLINFMKPCKVIKYPPWFSPCAQHESSNLFWLFNAFATVNFFSFPFIDKIWFFITFILNQLANLHYRVFRDFSSRISMFQCITFEFFALDINDWFDAMRHRMFNK